MTRIDPPRQIRLAQGKLLDIHDGQGYAVACLAGTLWITQSNDPRDIVLEAGESFVLDKPGLALVNAAGGPCVLTVDAAPLRARTDRVRLSPAA